MPLGRGNIALFVSPFTFQVLHMECVTFWMKIEVSEEGGRGVGALREVCEGLIISHSSCNVFSVNLRSIWSFGGDVNRCRVLR